MESFELNLQVLNQQLSCQYLEGILSIELNHMWAYLFYLTLQPLSQCLNQFSKKHLPLAEALGFGFLFGFLYLGNVRIQLPFNEKKTGFKGLQKMDVLHMAV